MHAEKSSAFTMDEIEMMSSNDYHFLLMNVKKETASFEKLFQHYCTIKTLHYKQTESNFSFATNHFFSRGFNEIPMCSTFKSINVVLLL